MKEETIELELPPLPRRGFLGVAGAAGAGCLGAVDVAFSADPRGLNAAAFESHVGSRMRIQGETSGSASLELREAQAHAFDPNRPSHVRREPFSLIFRAPPGAEFPDQMCHIWHPRLGKIEAFLSRVGPPRKDGNDLQAVFG